LKFGGVADFGALPPIKRLIDRAALRFIVEIEVAEQPLAPANRAILMASGMGLSSWNKNRSAMTGSMLRAACTVRSARSTRIGS
jgi:hypothetical protein